VLKHPIYANRRPIPEPPLVASTTALLIVDVQRYVADPDYGYGSVARANGTFRQMAGYYSRIRRILPRIHALQEACRAKGIEVMFTRIEALTRDGRESTPGYRLSRLLVPRDSPEAEILPAIAPADDEIILRKTSSSAFNSTPVDQVLRNLGIRLLIVAGIATHACVELTVRDADDRGYWVYVVADASTAATVGLHRNALVRMSKGLVRIKTSDEVIALLAAL
jgi:nicotinamidase-related amidase